MEFYANTAVALAWLDIPLALQNICYMALVVKIDYNINIVALCEREKMILTSRRFVNIHHLLCQHNQPIRITTP